MRPKIPLNKNISVPKYPNTVLFPNNIPFDLEFKVWASDAGIHCSVRPKINKETALEWCKTYDESPSFKVSNAVLGNIKHAK